MESARRLLYRVAQAYYEEELTQAEVANRFGVSRIKVSRMLTRAREEGVVRIDVIPPQETQTSLERELESIFGLDEAIVAEADGDDYQDVLDSIGRAAADYVIRVLEDGQTLGLTWGNTILATVNALPHASLPRVRAVQMLGGLGELEAEIHGAELVRRAAERLGCRPRNIHAPGIVASKAVRDALVGDPQVADTLELGRTADVALLGIGALGPHSVLRGAESVLTQADCRGLVEQGVVGDIALRFFNADGKPVATPFAERTIGVGLEEIRGIGKRVGVAGGPEKRAAMLAALRGGHVNVLVTDADTACAIVREQNRHGLSKPERPAKGR
jgi:DNA-binding transcriptional regulator LsrR (DeoR family)